VETKDEDLEKLVQAHCRLDLTAPMPGCTGNHQRNLLFEGDLKLKEGTSSKFDVHAFLFSDMLLLCKVLTKKSHSSNPEARMKIIRQPFIVDRLLVSEINKDGQMVGLAAVYLNEYRVASAAFTLHSQEPKVLKVWREQILKAKEIYQEAKSASRIYQLPGQYSADVSVEEEVGNYLTAEVPSGSGRRGSFRGSRISSVGHSHSGSMDLMETGSLPSGFRREVSLELSHGCSVGSMATDQNRASSLSSEEGAAAAAAAAAAGGVTGGPTAGGLTSGNSLESNSSSVSATTGAHLRNQSSYPSSPRAERKVQLFKTNTPNTLTVQIPYAPVQSLPNLGPPTSPQTPNHPGGVLDYTPGGQQQHQPSGGGRASSPGIPPRGISYPPVSPKSSLRRQKVLQASQSNSNGQTPPLLKSRTVTTDGITIPVITGVPCSNIDDEMEESHNLEEKSIEDSGTNSGTPGTPCTNNSGTNISEEKQQTNRKGRIDRGADARRYHTAGAIEDIKKQDVKDNSIQKRLSWNYGQHIPNNELSLQQQSRLPVGGSTVTGGRNSTNKCLSNESMHSSSGVSSTGSLHLSIGSEWEESTASTGTVVTATHIYRNLSSSKEEDGCKVPEAANISSLNSKEIIKSAPTISSSAAPSKNLNLPPPVPPRTNHSHHVTTTYITQDEVTVSTSSSNFNTTNAVPGATAGVGAAADASADQVQISVMSNDPTKKPEIMTLRDMLLTDNSVESSNV